MRGSVRLQGKMSLAALVTAAALVSADAVCGQESDTSPPAQSVQQSPALTVKAPLALIENQGQTDARVKFYLPGGRGTVFFTEDEVVFKLMKPAAPASKDEKGSEPWLAPKQGVVIRMSFPGANAQVRLEGIDPLPGRINDIRGNDPAKWRKDIRTFGGVVYRDLYPGIDLEYRTGEGNLQRKLIVRDRSQLAKVQFRYAGTDELRLGDKGALELATAVGTVHEAPIAAVEPEHGATGAALKYAVLSGNTVGLIQ